MKKYETAAMGAASNFVLQALDFSWRDPSCETSNADVAIL